MRADWWPWWISSLIDLGILALAVLVAWRARRALVRRIALGVAAVALLAAVLAPVVMRVDDSETMVSDQGGMVWVADRELNNVVVFDAATGAVIGTVAVGSGPNSVVVARQRGKAYVTNEGEDSVSVVSTSMRAEIAKIAVGSKPHHMRVSRDGGRVYVSLFGTNEIAVIDTATDEVVATFATHPNEAARNHSSWITNDGRTVYVVNETVNEVSALDAESGSRRFSIAVGDRPSEVVSTGDGSRLFVSMRGGENAIKVIDVAGRSVEREVALAEEPDTLQLSRDGRFLMVGLRGSPAQLAVVDATALRLVATVQLAGPGTTASHNWLSANGRYSFVAFEGGTEPGLAVVDHDRQVKVATYRFPRRGTPHGVYYDDPAASR